MQLMGTFLLLGLQPSSSVSECINLLSVCNGFSLAVESLSKPVWFEQQHGCDAITANLVPGLINEQPKQLFAAGDHQPALNKAIVVTGNQQLVTFTQLKLVAVSICLRRECSLCRLRLLEDEGTALFLSWKMFLC